MTGSTTLTSWLNGGDNTKIDGGAIAANTIAANKLTIGMRGIDATSLEFSQPGANGVAWSTAQIIYTNDAGSPVGVNTTAGSATWTTGRSLH